MDLFRPLWEAILGFAAVWALGLIIRQLSHWSTRKIQQQGRGWPFAHGTVEYAEPKMIGQGKTAHWVGELAYSYLVEGEYYSGVFHLPAGSEDKAWTAVNRWKGRSIVVHYLPNAPERSLLIMEEQNQPVANDFDSL